MALRRQQMIQPFFHCLPQIVVRPAERGIAAGDEIILLALQGAAGARIIGAGFANRFGIVYVDYATQRRVPKASFDWFAELIRAQQHGDRA